VWFDVAEIRKPLSEARKREVLAKARAVTDAGHLDLLEAIVRACWSAAVAEQPELAAMFPDEDDSQTLSGPSAGEHD
jgi:hypothetical protein